MIRYILILFFISLGLKSEGQNIDIETLDELQEHRSPALVNGFIFITRTAPVVNLALPIGLFIDGAIRNDKTLKNASLRMGVSWVATTLVTQSLKSAIHRNRPFTDYSFIHPEVSASGYSFPSGHTSAAFSTATSLSLSFPKWYVVVPAYTWASAVGFSRCYLGVHYPSDVIAGAMVGSGCAYLTHVGQKWINNVHHKHKHEALIEWEP
ncbi:phosphatase PAP2 family protein [Solitalea sp. MAHUQ-68]|uniref:Phosphatase PAP2 family protein n=1 Tax=Solitalea agri TaxID=2953739 RepID=A0A9X2JDV2_9SPHI|nr:phosphatase PAP2 family protein [Solitalea agri]MCO4294518.1 phosphatase PAP2 family protein [Solitalea agri]